MAAVSFLEMVTCLEISVYDGGKVPKGTSHWDCRHLCTDMQNRGGDCMAGIWGGDSKMDNANAGMEPTRINPLVGTRRHFSDVLEFAAP